MEAGPDLRHPPGPHQGYTLPLPPLPPGLTTPGGRTNVLSRRKTNHGTRDIHPTGQRPHGGLALREYYIHGHSHHTPKGAHVKAGNAQSLATAPPTATNLTLLTINAQKAGANSPSLSDVVTMLDDLSPDILFLT